MHKCVINNATKRRNEDDDDNTMLINCEKVMLGGSIGGGKAPKNSPKFGGKKITKKSFFAIFHSCRVSPRLWSFMVWQRTKPFKNSFWLHKKKNPPKREKKMNFLGEFLHVERWLGIGKILEWSLMFDGVTLVHDLSIKIQKKFLTH